MGFMDFFQHTTRYLLTHKMSLTPGGQINPVQMAALVPNVPPVHGSNVAAVNNPYRLLLNGHAPYPPGLQGMIRSLQQKQVWYGQNPIGVAAAGGGVAGFATLPWNDDTVTYCNISTLAPAATMVLTGPLTGCHLAAFRAPAAHALFAGNLFFMHANANAMPGLATTNAMIDHVMTAVLGMPAGTPRADCIFGVNYTGLAFAFAQVNGAHASFYVHDVPGPAGGVPGPGGRSTTRRWAYF